MLDINLKGTFFCIVQPASAACQQGQYRQSRLGCRPDRRTNLTVYCACKGGVVNMTRAMALELAPDIRVNCVCPGYVDTDMVRRDGIDEADNPVAAEQALIDYAPLKRIATPGDIAKAIVYLASEDARFVTGAAFQIDGGSTAGHSRRD